MNEIKLLFSGPMGAGKTTAIAAVSDAPPLRTDVTNTDTGESAKATTTVALDYGELRLESGQAIKLFGTPGQDRFAFLRSTLALNALGVVLLMDNTRPDPLEDFRKHLESFRPLLTRGRVVVGIGRTEQFPLPACERYIEVLSQLGATAPVFTVDVRRRNDVLLLLDALLYQIESHEMTTDPESGFL